MKGDSCRISEIASVSVQCVANLHRSLRQISTGKEGAYGQSEGWEDLAYPTRAASRSFGDKDTGGGESIDPRIAMCQSRRSIHLDERLPDKVKGK